MNRLDFPTGFSTGSAAHIFRWVPSPRLRRMGWKTVTLKHASGQHMSMGEAIDVCLAINSEVLDWHDHNIPPRKWAHIAPKTLRRIDPGPDHSIKAMIDAFYASDECAALSPDSRRHYKTHLLRLCETLAGFVKGRPLDPLGADRYDAALNIIHHSPVSDLTAKNAANLTPMERAITALKKHINLHTGLPCTHMAKACLTYSQAWLNWVIRKHPRALSVNPCYEIKLSAARGRVVVWSKDEINRLLDLCYRSGWHSIGFAVELALELSWSEADILGLTWDQIRDKRVKGTRSKTQNMTHTSLTRAGQDLITRIKAHYQAIMGDKVDFGPGSPVLLMDKIKGRASKSHLKPWRFDNFRHVFATLRDALGLDEDKRFADFRDTAITRMKEAGLTDHEIQSRSQHSLQQIRNIMDKHYGMTTLEISDAAARKLDHF